MVRPPEALRRARRERGHCGAVAGSFGLRQRARHVERGLRA
jgi:hypothetical protein